MRIKLHVGVVITLFIFLGRFIDTATLPNQQIVIQFSDKDDYKTSNEEALKSIQIRLQSIGVKDIKVLQNKEGQLKITYYSEANVDYIKSILASDHDISFQHSKEQKEMPDTELLKHYEVSVSEINESSSPVSWDFATAEVLEINHKTDRYTNAELDFSAIQFKTSHANLMVGHSLKSFKLFLLTKSKYTFNNPEVRAGPLS